MADAKAQLDENEASVATFGLNDNSSSNETQNLQMTIQFASDFKQTDVYREYKATKKNVSSITELRELKKVLTDYSKIYHRELVEKNLALLDGIEYYNIEMIDYSPFVVLDMNATSIETSILSNLCESSSVDHISVGYEMVAQTSEGTILEPSPTAGWNDCMNSVNAYDIVNNGTDNGDL